MGRKFEDYVRRVERESPPEGRAELEAFRAHHRRARQVRERRKALRLTQTELAELAAVDQSEISRLETGQGNPTEDTLTRVAGALNAEWTLVGRDGGLSRDESPSRASSPA